jgi:hypothetical protein
MAKARKRTTIADSNPPRLTWNDWMPVAAAFLHIKQVVGGEQLAEEDLRLSLLSGDVEAQGRWVTHGEGINVFPLLPEDFEGPPALLFWPPSLSCIATPPSCAALICSALMATTYSCAALTCTAYGRSPLTQRSRQRNGRRSNCRRRGPRVLAARRGSS